jgi:hypothetical protein
MPSPFPDSRGAAEYRRNSHSASTPRMISATSRPARAALASAACLPRRSRAAPGVAGRMAGHMTTIVTRTMMTTAGHQAPSEKTWRTAPKNPAAERPGGSPLTDISRFAR